MSNQLSMKRLCFWAFPMVVSTTYSSLKVEKKNAQSWSRVQWPWSPSGRLLL